MKYITMVIYQQYITTSILLEKKKLMKLASILPAVIYFKYITNSIILRREKAL